jgi:hypothetical protein
MIAIRMILSMLLLWASAAQAFIDPPVITPENPTTETHVEVSIRWGVCDALLDYMLEVSNGTVDLTIDKLPTQSDPFCINPIETYTFVLPLLAEGQHSLSIYLKDSDPPNSQPILWFQTILTVRASGSMIPQPVPSISGWIPLLLLASGTLIIVSWRLAGSIPKFGGRNR